MGKLLNRLLDGSPAYTVSREDGGFMLVGNADRIAEFSQLVREMADRPNDEFVVFPTCYGSGYSQVFVCPFDDAAEPSGLTA